MLIALPASIQVTVAPDQPLPYVYVDDPLIIEFLSQDEMDINVTMDIQASHETTENTIDLGRIHLHAASAYWYAVHDAPRYRGFYTATISMNTNNGTTTEQVHFCRIDRPASLQHIPIYAYCGDTDEKHPFPAIHSIGIDTFRCDMDNTHFMGLAQNVALYESNLIVAMTQEHANQFTEEETERIQSQCENIFRLDISLTDPDRPKQNIMDTIRKIGCPAGVSIVVHSTDTFEQQLQANPSLSARHATLMTFVWPDPSEIQTIREIAARQGQEGWQVHVLCPAWKPRDTDQTIQFIHRFLQYRAVNASFIGINANVLANATGVQEMMAYMNGLALCFHNNTYVGTLPTDETAQILVFRRGAAWFAALWSEKKNASVSIPVNGALSLKLNDARGNELPIPELVDGAITLSTSPAPLYLTGNGGIILGKAALQALEKEAKTITASEIMIAQLPPDIPELINDIVADPQGAGSRLRFLDLLRTLPRLEEDWHTRKLPREVAVPAIRSIAKLARTLCLVEEDRGERFLEPLTDTLDRAAELQSLYLTGSAGTAQARKRGDWVLGEVRRLIDEAESLNQAGRKIEATAVAALAEWRAHCLLHAAKAEPVRETVQEIQPLIIPEPVEETVNPPDVETEDDLTQEAIEDEPEEESTQEEDSEETTTQEEVKKPEDSAISKEIVHKVKSGDNPYTIAKKYGVSLDDLLKWNNLKKRAILQIGQELIVKIKKE